jgi:hypothetical protein
MTLFGDMVGPLVRDLFDLVTRSAQYLFRIGQIVVLEVWHHPFPYAVSLGLSLALTLWGRFCLRFVPEDP